ncbi:MAG: hypothetical protein RBS48_03185 [Ignavibacteriaceae bacterium]|jgi:hypothetical protein|nr:hypothetical protein [Ignavibacteriaceae bacterium]
MKLFLVLFLISCSIYAQEIDSNSVAATDSISISEMVQSQITNALETGSHSSMIKNVPEIVEVPKAAIKPPVKNNSASVLDSFSLEIKIFVTASLLIIFFVAARRMLSGIKHRSGSKLKKKIGLMREEKVLSSVDPKKTKIRRSLKNKSVLNNIDSKKLTKKAKQLQIPQGELALAAHLKYLELKRI